MSNLHLPATIASPQDLSALLMEIQEYTRWFEHETVKRKMQVTQQTTPPVLAPSTGEYLRDLSRQQPLSVARLDAVMSALEEYKTTAPRVTITLAVPITPPIRTQLIQWFRVNISPAVLVTFQFNSTLLGGMVVRCGSRVFDWSFRRQILHEQPKLTEALSRV